MFSGKLPIEGVTPRRNTVKIDHTTGLPIPLPTATKRRSAGSSVEPEQARQETGGANVREMPGAPDGTFDAARVAQIREDIHAGRYHVNPERIADGLIASLKETLSGGSE